MASDRYEEQALTVVSDSVYPTALRYALRRSCAAALRSAAQEAQVRALELAEKTAVYVQGAEAKREKFAELRARIEKEGPL